MLPIQSRFTKVTFCLFPRLCKYPVHRLMIYIFRKKSLSLCSCISMTFKPMEKVRPYMCKHHWNIFFLYPAESFFPREKIVCRRFLWKVSASMDVLHEYSYLFLLKISQEWEVALLMYGGCSTCFLNSD